MAKPNKDQQAESELKDAPATNEVSTPIEAVADGVEREHDLAGKDQQAESESGDDEIEKDLVASLGPQRCQHPGCPNYATHLVHRRRNSYANGPLEVTDFDTQNCLQHIGPASTYENYELLK